VATYLDSILAFHRERAARDTRVLSDLVAEAAKSDDARGFRRSLADSDHLAVIAEIKRRSPSKGDLNADLDPGLMARSYEEGGATCLSVLTDEPHFGGSATDLRSARHACSLPVLRKDFTVDTRDVCDARIMGADCVLLIAAALSESEMRDCLSVATDIGIDALVEVHDEVELDVAMRCGATLIGVNQRDLVTFEVDHERAVRMGQAIPSSVVSVAESGVRGREDAMSLRQAGYDAVLVGEHLVTAPDPVKALRDLLVL
jgi:indole-3-glycerol phosphate synthase